MQTPERAGEVFWAGCDVQRGQHVPQALGVNRLNANLLAGQKEGFQPLVTER